MADEPKTFTQADIDAAVEKATGDIDGLKGKIEELIGDNKKLKDQVRRAGEIKPEDLAAVEKERDDLQARLTDATKSAKDAITRADKAEKALVAEQGFTHRLVAENGVVDALTKAGVSDPAYLEAAKALHLSAVKVVADGDNRTAMYGDKPLADAIKEWAGGEVGKKFVAAPVNSGGGAGGGGGSGGAKQVTRSEFDAMDQSARGNFAKEGGKVVDA